MLQTLKEVDERYGTCVQCMNMLDVWVPVNISQLSLPSAGIGTLEKRKHMRTCGRL